MPRKVIKTQVFLENGPSEMLAEVPIEKTRPWGEKEELRVVGKPVNRIDALDKVTGKAVYTYDIQLPGMAVARIMRSPHPHARLKSINIKKALEVEGVYDIITADNSEEIPWHWGTTRVFDKTLRFQGDEVACVAASSERAALEAISLIEADYETLPFYILAEDGKKPDGVKIHPSWGSNIIMGEPGRYKRGDVEAAFSSPDAVIVEDAFTTQQTVHNPTEVHCSVAMWEGDHLTLWDSTQAIFAVRNEVAGALRMPSSKVRVIKKFMGGGFGSKLEAGKYSVMAAVMAKRIKRPVKILLDRREMNMATGHRPDSNQHLKAAVKADGTLLALKLNQTGSVGAYPDGADCGWPVRTLYSCPNVEMEEFSMLSNTGKSRAFRAPGHVQGIFALESFMDVIAEKLNMDPIEFRLKNYAEKDPDSGQPYTSKRLREAYIQGAKAIGWNEKRKAPDSDTGHIKRGIGMASQIWWGGGNPPSYCTIKLNQDGSLNLLSGTQDLGTGTMTFMAQIASEELEIPMERIQVTIGDTENCPFSLLSGGSLTAPSLSPAVRDAAVQMKNKLISASAAILEVPEEEIVYSQGVLSSSKNAEKKLGITEIMQRMGEEVLITTGAREANPNGYAINTFGAQFAEVEVDTMTGKVKVIRIAAAHDVGRVLNRKTLENQFHGGIIMGLGYALLEEKKIDLNTGKVLTTNLYDFKMPVISDAPEIEVIIVSDGDPLISNTGVKGIGEPAIIPTAAAVANAIYNAIGVRIKSLPISPDKVLDALKNKQ